MVLQVMLKHNIMSENKLIIPIYLPVRNIELTIYGENSEETLIEKSDAIENGEAPFPD